MLWGDLNYSKSFTPGFGIKQQTRRTLIVLHLHKQALFQGVKLMGLRRMNHVTIFKLCVFLLYVLNYTLVFYTFWQNTWIMKKILNCLHEIKTAQGTFMMLRKFLKHHCVRLYNKLGYMCVTVIFQPSGATPKYHVFPTLVMSRK